MSEITDASAAQLLIGYVIAVEGEGRVLARLEVEARHGNRAGVLHGGIASALLDVAMGTASATRADPSGRAPMATISMTTQFLAPVPLGQRVEARARIVGGGRRLIFCEAALHLADGTLAATAAGVFRTIRAG